MIDVALITVRTHSTRLPQKCLLPFGEGNVLDHVIERAKFFELEPIIATTNLPEDDIIEAIADRHETPCCRGSVEDKLDRWLITCKRFNIREFHTVDADDPFFDGKMCKNSLRILRENSQDMVAPFGDYIGQCGYSLTKPIIEKACAIKKSANTEMMWHFVEDVPGIHYYPECKPEMDVRLTLDYPEDYALLLVVLQNCGWNASGEKIIEFFKWYPQYAEINWFRNDQWTRRQKEQYENKRH